MQSKGYMVILLLGCLAFASSGFAQRRRRVRSPRRHRPVTTQLFTPEQRACRRRTLPQLRRRHPEWNRIQLSNALIEACPSEEEMGCI